VFKRRKSLFERWLDNEPPASPHLWITGGTGMGKTTFARSLVLHILERGGRVTIIDYDGEYNLPLPTLRPPFPINVDSQGVPPEMSNNRAGESPAPALNETPRGVKICEVGEIRVLSILQVTPEPPGQVGPGGGSVQEKVIN